MNKGITAYILLSVQPAYLILVIVVILVIITIGFRRKQGRKHLLKFRNPGKNALQYLSTILKAEVRQPYEIERAFNFEGEVEPEPELLEAIQGLQHNEQLQPSRVMDHRSTINALIQQGGFTAQITYKTQTSQPSQYLFLIEQLSPRDHRAKTFGLICQMFLEANISCDRFFFSNDIRLCRNEQYPNGIYLWHLSKYYPEHHLIIIGSGRQLLDISNGQLASWTTIFEEWPQRAVLSHTPSRQWGRMERNISLRFLLLPASYQSFAALPGLFRSEKNISGIYRLEHTGSPQISIQGDNIVQQLGQWYAPRHLHWIAACALYPRLIWNLTLHIGQWMQEQITVSDLMELSRLPWFIEGQIPDEARKQLLEYLEDNEPEVAEGVRKEILQLWEKHQDVLDDTLF